MLTIRVLQICARRTRINISPAKKTDLPFPITSSYLWSMLRRETTEEEAEQEALIEAILEHGVKVKGKGPLAQEKGDPGGGGRRLNQDDRD